MLKKSRILRRMEARNLVRFANIRVNSVRGSKTESEEHFLTKARICKMLMDRGDEFITEAMFESKLNMKDNCKRADIFITDNLTIIEIYKTESKESLERKEKYYADKGLNFFSIKSGADREEIYELVRWL